MSYEFAGDGTEYHQLTQRIMQLEQAFDSIPYQFPGINDGTGVAAISPSISGGGAGGGSGVNGVETDYIDEGDTSGDITITVDGNKKYVRKYTLTGNVTSITITSTNLTILFPTDLILIFEQTGTNEYTLPDVSALHPDTVLSQQVIIGGEIEEFEFVTYDAGTEWVLKSQHDNALLAYLENLTSAGWASLTNFAEGTLDAILGLGMAIEDGITYLWKQIDDAWENASGDTWEEKLVSLISTQLTSVLTNFGEQIIAWWNGLADDDDNNAVDEFFYQVKTIGAPIFEWMADWEDDTRSGDVTYSDPPTFEELSTGENAFHLRIIRGVSAWWDDLSSTSSDGFDPLFYRIKLIGEPVFNWMSDWENDTRASGTPANPTFDQLTTGENVVYKRVIRGVTSWWDELGTPAEEVDSAFNLPFAYVKEWFSLADDLGAWLFDTVVEPIQTWWDDTTETGTDADNSFPARAWRGITALGDAFVEDVLEGLGTVWEFFNENIITPVKEWWDDTEDTTTGADNTIPARVWRGIIALTPFGDDIVTEVTDGLDWAFDTVTETWDYIRGNVTDFGANILEGFGSAWAYFNSNIVTPIQTWWETTADTASPADDSIPARVWRGILDLGSAFTDGISDGVSDALDTAIEGLTFVDGTIRDWINDNLNVVAVRAGLLTLGTWLGEGASVITKVVTDLPGQLYTGATTFTHVVRGLLFGGISATAADWLEDRGTEIQAALGDAWVNVNNLVTEIGSDAADWLEEQSAEIVTALGDAGNTAWTWLQTLPGSARNFLTGITGTIHSTLDRIAGWVGTTSTALAWISDTLYDGATTFVDAAKEALFGGGTPEAFAESEADGQITSALSSGGDITAKIGADIDAAWVSFANSVQSGLTTTGSALTSFLSDLTGGLLFGDSGSTETGGSQGDIDVKTFDLRNVDRIFFNSNDGIKTNSDFPHFTASIQNGARNLRQYVKNGAGFYWQSGTTGRMNLTSSGLVVNQDINGLDDIIATNNITGDILTARDKIKVGTDSSAKVNGDMWLSGTNVMIKSGGTDRNISSSGGGSYTAATMENFLDGLDSVTSTTGTLSNTFMVDVGTVVEKMSLTTLKSIMSVANRDLSNLSNVDINTALLFDTQSAPASNANGIGRTTTTSSTHHIYPGFRFNLSDTDDAFYFDFNQGSALTIRRRTIGLPHSSTSQTDSITESPEGHIWYNDDDEKFQGRAGSTVVDLSGGGGGGSDLSAVAQDIRPSVTKLYSLGSSTYEWNALNVKNIFASGDISCRDIELEGRLAHTGDDVGFFNTGTTSQETWNDNVTSLAPAATRKAKTNDTESNLAGIINGILDRLDDLGLIEY